MLAKKVIKEVLSNTNNNFINDKTLISESLNLLQTMFNEVKNFNVTKEYLDIYLNFRNSVNNNCISCFPDILDFSARLIIHEIYLLHNDTTTINISFDKISKASSNNRKHFIVAKDIAERIIKNYYFSQCQNKKIINYIDDFLPDNYTKYKDINQVVWYFIVCIITFNKQVVNNIG